MGSGTPENEMTSSQLLQFYFAHWRLFAGLFFVMLLILTVIYAVTVKYRATAKVLINDPQNSSLQAFSQQFFGYSKSVQDGRKGGPLSKYSEYFKTREFYEKLYSRIRSNRNSTHHSFPEQLGVEQLFKDYADIFELDELSSEAHQYFHKSVRIEVTANSEVQIEVTARSKNIALVLANVTSDLIVEVLQDFESQDLARVEQFIKEQKQLSEKNLNELEEELKREQIQGQHLGSRAAQDKMGEYVSELAIRLNELKLKIAENEKAIAIFSSVDGAESENTVYGSRGQIEKLQLENNLLTEKLTQTMGSFKKMKAEVKLYPISSFRFESLQRKADFEFAKYKDLSSAITRLEAQKISLSSKFHVLELAHWDKIAPQFSLKSFFAASVLATLFLGFGILYFKYFWIEERSMTLGENRTGDLPGPLENMEPLNNEKLTLPFTGRGVTT